MPQPFVIIGIVIVAWVLQIVMSYRQAIAFSRRIADMRRVGTVAVGLGQGRFRSRTYAVVAIRPDGRVAAAEVLTGWSSLSAPKPIPNLPGLPIERLCGTPVVADLSPALQQALCQVVSTLGDDMAAKRGAEGGAPIVQRA